MDFLVVDFVVLCVDKTWKYLPFRTLNHALCAVLAYYIIVGLDAKGGMGPFKPPPGRYDVRCNSVNIAHHVLVHKERAT